MKRLSLDENVSRFICYNPESNNAVLYSYKELILDGIGYICNFPVIAREWEIPSNGIYISYSAEVFEACKGYSSIGGLTSFTDNILTSLKKYDK
ncbi:hypothetical protein ACE1ET_02085 [Saccharicrinis sp. FJH62]|uniref:hypothetical protein n=1 Tax=Saccharicrinis sp. FJH62 TaxID=3344657 RepID=UPI0035D48A47